MSEENKVELDKETLKKLFYQDVENTEQFILAQKKIPKLILCLQKEKG